MSAGVDDQVREQVRERLAEGVSAVRVAREFGLTRGDVEAIEDAQRWPEDARQAVVMGAGLPASCRCDPPPPYAGPCYRCGRWP